MIRLWRLTSGWRDMKTSFMRATFVFGIVAGFDRIQGIGSVVEGVGKELVCRQLQCLQEILPGGGDHRR
jgi:hypothetical protein